MDKGFLPTVRAVVVGSLNECQTDSAKNNASGVLLYRDDGSQGNRLTRYVVLRSQNIYYTKVSANRR